MDNSLVDKVMAWLESHPYTLTKDPEMVDHPIHWEERIVTFGWCDQGVGQAWPPIVQASRLWSEGETEVLYRTLRRYWLPWYSFRPEYEVVWRTVNGFTLAFVGAEWGKHPAPERGRERFTSPFHPDRAQPHLFCVVYDDGTKFSTLSAFQEHMAVLLRDLTEKDEASWKEECRVYEIWKGLTEDQWRACRDAARNQGVADPFNLLRRGWRPENPNAPLAAPPPPVAATHPRKEENRGTSTQEGFFLGLSEASRILVELRSKTKSAGQKAVLTSALGDIAALLATGPQAKE